MAVLGLRFCVRAFSSCGERGPRFIAVCGPLTIAASLVVEHRLQMRRLSSCGSWAQLLRSMWDPPRPGLEPVSPALAGGFSTTAPPGKLPMGLVLPTFNFGRLLTRPWAHSGSSHPPHTRSVPPSAPSFLPLLPCLCLRLWSQVWILLLSFSVSLLLLPLD